METTMFGARCRPPAKRASGSSRSIFSRLWRWSLERRLSRAERHRAAHAQRRATVVRAQERRQRAATEAAGRLSTSQLWWYESSINLCGNQTSRCILFARSV